MRRRDKVGASLPNIDFQKIRPHRGSQHHGFEELCCQIASLETWPAADVFHRKGIGADAGVECFVKHANGSETGWQAKWFQTFGDSQTSQLDKSIAQALEKHPRLTKYIVCLPIDLRDARVGRGRTELQRWQAWVKKWERHARKSRRLFSVELWNATLLIQRLTRTDPQYAGRLRYWFDHAVLDAEWFKQRFAASRASLGERYTPETNVDLPIRRVLLTFGRDPVVQQEVEDWFGKLEEARYRAIDSLEHRISKDKKDRIEALEQETLKLAQLISQAPLEPSGFLPVAGWIDQAERALKASYPCISTLRESGSAGTKGDKDGKEYAVHSVHRLDSVLHEFKHALNDHHWRIVNDRRLLVFGDAGVGKSHLFGDAAEHWIVNEQPAILVLGSYFADADPWTQILEQIGLQGFDRDTFLGAFDASGQAAGTRAVLMIDAINERNGLEVWPSRLAAFLESIEKFPHVAVVLSCRSSYLPFLVDSIDETRLPRIEHVGFSGRAGEAAKTYLDRRGVVRMAAPNLVPESENPLFLKTCCDYLLKEGRTEFPRGMRGVTEIFQFYFTAVAHQIEKKLKLDPNQNIVERAITALAERADESERGYIPKMAAQTVLEAVFPSQGLYDRSLLAHLASEGVLSVEPIRMPDGSSQAYVRFTFERYSDHRIAAYLFGRYLDPAKPGDSFAAGSVLYAYLSDRKAYEKMGIIEAMAIQLPELSGAELPDAVPKDVRTEYIVPRAFLQSVLWRNQKCFSKRTVELLEEISRLSGNDELMPVLISVATEPENSFNILYLHELLRDISIAERDERWSIYVAESGDSDSHPIQTLIDWVTYNGSLSIDDERAELAAIALTWCFTTSHRGIRDRATKALSALLSVRLPLAVKLIRRFVGINDSYVLDRVLAAAYGAALQRRQSQGVGELASAAFEAVFGAKETLPHVLIRDHARGIVEFANAEGVLPADIDVARARPPYTSSWPLEEVSEETVERYVQKYKTGTFTDAIVGSTVHDGDFARYEIDPAVDRWSTLPISAAGKTQEQLFTEWERSALLAKPGAEKALRKVIAAYDQRREEEAGRQNAAIQREIVRLLASEKPEKSEADDAGSKARKRKDAAFARLESQLKRELGAGLWDEYRLYARAYVQRGIYGLDNHWPSHFNSIQVRRWVCKRAHDLGWTAERFAAFDGSVRYVDRHTHRLERIGKKYQWIALHEALAHLADNAAYIGWQRKTLGVFQGPWETGTRDMDPSLFATETFDDPWKQWGPAWWMPAKTNLRPVTPAERLLWLDSPDDMWNNPGLIQVSDPCSGKSWLVLDESVAWHQSGLDRGDRTLERRAFFVINCLLVRSSERKKLVRSLAGKMLYGNHDLPSIGLPDSVYIGEHCWHPMYAQSDEWAEPDTFRKIPVQTQPMDAEYSAKRGEFDYSLAESFVVKLPAAGLTKKLGLRLIDGKRMSFADASGEVVFLDPSTMEAGPRASLVDRTAFLKFLEREELEAVWIVASNKEVFGSKRHDGGWGGERAKCSLYWLKGDGFGRKDYEERKDPSQDQLQKFWGDGGKSEATDTEHRRQSVKRKKVVKKKKPRKGEHSRAGRRARIKTRRVKNRR